MVNKIKKAVAKKLGEKKIVGFQKGKSGNPKGRPKGSIAAASMALKQKLVERGNEAIGMVISKMLEGDMQALKLCIDKILPNCKIMPFEIDLPKITTLTEVNEAMDKVIDRVSKGHITTEEGQAIMTFIECKHKLLVSTDLEKRIQELETIAKEN